MKTWRLFLIFCLFFSSVWANERPTVILVLSAKLKPYFQVRDGFRKIYPQTQEFILPEDASLARHSLKRDNLLVVAIGSRALSFLDQLPENFKLFYTLVVSPEIALSLAPKHQPTCGIYLQLPPEITFPLVKEHLSHLFAGKESLTIAIPFSTPEGKKFVEEARPVAQKLRLQIMELPVTPEKPFKDILKKSWEKFDIFYFIPDPVFSSEAIIKFFIKQALFHHKAVCGYNRFFYEQGAVLAFVIDYFQTGEKTAWLVIKNLKGESCQPEIAAFNLLINQKVLKFLQESNLGDFQSQNSSRSLLVRNFKKKRTLSTRYSRQGCVSIFPAEKWKRIPMNP